MQSEVFRIKFLESAEFRAKVKNARRAETMEKYKILFMLPVVSYSTAKKLKDAGFPQPIPAIGQFWATSERNITVAGLGGRKPLCVVWRSNGKLAAINKAVYLPTSHDIQIEFSKVGGGNIEIGYRSHLSGYRPELKRNVVSFCCYETWGTQVDLKQRMHSIADSPHEAAADVYLEFMGAKVYKKGGMVIYKDSELPAILAVKQLVESGESLGDVLTKVNSK